MSTPARSRWWRLVWIAPLAIVLLAAAVLAARALRDTPAVADFMAAYPGESALPATAAIGLPSWLGWQHFLNGLFLLLIIRSGLEVRNTKRPAAYWTRRNSGPFRTKGQPHRISLSLWFHLSLDALWVLNGIVFYVLVFASGHWLRIVPTSWDVFPNAVSVGIQYLSLDWPTENGWVNYNALQLLSYFVIVFIAAPLAIITGLRMSPAWPAGAKRLNAIYPVGIARAIHFPLMLVFVAFVIAHVTLVLATGALRNLNHMYATRDDATWWGFGIFAASIVVMIGAWFAASPIVLRAIASRSGSVTR